MITKSEMLSKAKVGDFFPYFGSSAPEGFLFCDGAGFATTGTYAALFEAIQYTFGGSGSTFNVPDSRGSLLVGAGSADDSDATFGAINTNFGTVNTYSGKQTQATAVPLHSHTQSGNHSHGGSYSRIHGHGTWNYSMHTTHTDRIYQATSTQSYYDFYAIHGSGSNGTTGSSAPALAINANWTGVSISGVAGHAYGIGGAAEHPNMMPWMVCPFIIKYTY